MSKSSVRMLSLTEIRKAIENADYSGAKKTAASAKITSALAQIKNVPTRVSEGEIASLFDLSYMKFGDDSFKFLLKMFIETVKMRKQKSSLYVKEISIVFNKKLNDISKIKIKELDISDEFFERFDFIQPNDFENDPYYFKNLVSEIFQTQKSKSKSREEVESLLYVYIMSLKYKEKDFAGLSLRLERALTEDLSQQNIKSIEKHLWSDIPKILVSKKPRPQLEKLSFLYFGQNDQITKLYLKTNYLQKSLDEAQDNLNEANKQIKLLLGEKEYLEKTKIINQEKISVLQKDNLDNQNRLDFEKNKFEMQFINSKDEFISHLKKRLKLEVQGMEDIVQNYSDKEKTMLNRRINNIYLILNNAGDK